MTTWVNKQNNHTESFNNSQENDSVKKIYLPLIHKWLHDAKTSEMVLKRKKIIIIKPSISIILCSLTTMRNYERITWNKKINETKDYNLKAPTWSKLLSQMDRRLINAWDEKKSLNQALCCTMSEHQSTSLKLINYLVHNTSTLTSKVKSLTTVQQFITKTIKYMYRYYTVQCVFQCISTLCEKSRLDDENIYK